MSNKTTSNIDENHVIDTMDLRNRIIAPALSTDKGGGQIFDLDSFVKRILLFDTFILKTNQLTEIPYLIDVFTFDGLFFSFR